MKFTKEFKEAISQLPPAEKDKLLFRLLKKDLNLANRLYFELLDKSTVDQRRAKMEVRIKSEVVRMTKTYWSIGYLKMHMRYLSGEITEHVRITKDKFGEASLNLLMLNEVLSLNSDRVLEAPPRKASKLCIYVIARAFKILILIQKFHEDYFIEFEEDLKALGELIGNNDYLMRTAMQNGFDVNWLVQSEIPEDLQEIHAELRANGYLK